MLEPFKKQCLPFQTGIILLLSKLSVRDDQGTSYTQLGWSQVKENSVGVNPSLESAQLQKQQLP